MGRKLYVGNLPYSASETKCPRSIQQMRHRFFGFHHQRS